MSGKMIAYGRVSTKEQKLDRQLIAFRELGIKPEHIFIEKQSGKDFNRPIYQKMKKILKKGDTLVINIKTRYLIQSHLWVQSSKSLTTRGFGDFVIFGHRAS